MSTTTTTTVTTNPKPKQKTAILFCCLPSHEIINELLSALRRHSYHVPLLITCPLAFNYAMDTAGIHAMASTIGHVIDKIWDPPAVLAVTSTKQCEDIYCALDPDLALCYYFAYPISARMLRGRAKVVNLHPGKLPRERGPFPGVWPTLRPEKYGMEDLGVTVHYMNEGVDCGPVIREYGLQDEYPKDTTLENRPIGLLEVATPLFFRHLDEIIELVEAGYEGTPQQQPEKPPQSAEGMTYGARRPTDEERTILPSMTREQVLRLNRALGETDGLCSPYFWWKGRRYWVERLEGWEWPGKEQGKPGDVKRVGFDLVVMFEGGAVRMAARTK